MLTRHVLPRREKTEAANELGTLVHWWKETGDTRPDFAKARDSATLEKKIDKSGVVRDEWWPEGTGVHEYTFALQPSTLELRIHAGPRAQADQWKKSFGYTEWLTGTLDWYEPPGLDDARVDDLKTGAWPVWAKWSKQLRSYALVPWVQEGCPTKWTCRTSITRWPRYPLAGLPTRHWHTLTGFDMMEHLSDVRWTLSHPSEVNVVPADEETGKMSPCSGCECREPFPASEWFTNFWYRTLPHCTEGMMKQIRKAYDGN